MNGLDLLRGNGLPPDDLSVLAIDCKDFEFVRSLVEAAEINAIAGNAR
jgi:hypothetical protein